MTPAEFQATMRSWPVCSPDEMPLMEIDPVRIREVLLNLLSNAVRHTSDHHSRQNAAETAPCRVIATGVGIPPQELPRILDRFHKGRDSRDDGYRFAADATLAIAIVLSVLPTAAWESE